MKYLLLFLLLQINGLPNVMSNIDRSSDIYEKSIEAYKKNEFWSIWAFPISNIITASTTKKATPTKLYDIKNIQDLNLNTAWVFEKDSLSGNQHFEYKFKFPPNTAYAGAYEFNGICELFNGYCKSLKAWGENARIKTLLVYYNDHPVCYVTLIDTWHYQYFDIAKFFKNKRDKKYLNARYEIKNGDKLKFEIVDIYNGSKYTDVAISEFLCEGGGN